MRVNSVESDFIFKPEYVIWRRWEDLLWFQEWLEQKYITLWRYRQQKIDNVGRTTPTSISRLSLTKAEPTKELQTYVPKMSHKGGIFRESETLAGQRQAQLKSFIMGLFRTDPTTILRKIQTAGEVADFFSTCNFFSRISFLDNDESPLLFRSVA